MLYGSKQRQELVLREAHKYAKTMDAKLIFGAMVGSVSKNVQYTDSDYDTRFLYLRKDFPEKIYVPSEMTEEELVKRYYPKDEVFEWIPFWEATSFLQFLLVPSFKNDFSVGLYNIVGWTFQSPYVWDPYGLKSKLIPLMNRIFRSDYEIAYHKKIIEKYRNELEQDQAVARNYLYAVHAAATIEWSLNYQEQPPIDLETLLKGLGRDTVWKESKAILDRARCEARAAWIEDRSQLGSLHFAVFTSKNPLLLEYVDEIYGRADLAMIKNKTGGWMEHPEDLVNHMYQIIYRSVFENEPLLYKGRSERT